MTDLFLQGVYVSVKNMNRAVAFYENLLERKPVETGGRMTIFDLDKAYFLLYDPQEDSSEINLGDNCVPVLATGNFDEIVNYLENQGTKLLREPEEVDGKRVVQFKDTEGNIIEVSERR